ncbi:hypothetical protein C9374_000666 [Naegleria lovaniensis]|uniref:F-box domain-containing protein n=1 Tax=Naegleria lovaniensis TaxID=51637 RepID=A0AA88GWT5_NAELO|nr:uncharacterized protein C9374_000666 [Naegleria lovaniensis]KAG2388502.1 hypothetical protein C9374_000666 [Naegleria lovaniensis]
MGQRFSDYFHSFFNPKNVDDFVPSEIRYDLNNKKSDALVILFIGTGESGKSTLIKNIRHLTNPTMCNYELINIRSTILYGMGKCIFSLMHHVGLDFVSTDCTLEDILRFKNRFMHDEVLQEAYRQRHLFHFPIENFMSLLDKIESVWKLNIGVLEDLERYMKTCGVIENEFKLPQTSLICIDTEGQRCGRKKWVHAYHKCDCIFYVISLSEFNQCCYEDDCTCRMEDSLGCFQKTLNDPLFPCDKPLYLIFNKVDVLDSKISNGFDLTCKFPEQTQLKGFKRHERYNCNTSLHPVATSLYDVSRLDHDTLSQIFSFLTPSELFNCMQVSKEFFRLARSDFIWFQQCRFQHPFISHNMAMQNIEMHCSNFEEKLLEESSVFYTYYKRKGFVLENSIAFMAELFKQHIPSFVNYRGCVVTNALDYRQTSETLVNLAQAFDVNIKLD